MGTNYFLYRKNPGDPLIDSIHIGKSSAGWCFSLHVIPEEKILKLSDWQRVLSQPNVLYIKNEYDEIITLEALLRTITQRSTAFGPLQRHVVDHIHCIGHGKGSYDYIVGWFR